MMVWRKPMTALAIAATAILLIGCQNNNARMPSGENEPKESEYASIYIAVFDSYFDIDPGLHEGMEYLAIDMDSLVNANETDQKAIAAHFAQKFKIEIKDASLEELKEQGLVHEWNSLDGLLLTIDMVDVTETTITIEGTKFKTGTGANYIRSVLEKSGNNWILISSGATAMA